MSLDPEVEAIITDACDKWFRLKPRFQGYEGMQLMLRVFADRILALGARRRSTDFVEGGG